MSNVTITVSERAGRRCASSFEVGEYWDKNMQLDVVGIRDDGIVDLGECKWGQVRSTTAIARELRAKAAQFPNRRDATVQLRVFTRAAVPRNPESADSADIRWHRLPDLYA